MIRPARPCKSRSRMCEDRVPCINIPSVGFLLDSGQYRESSLLSRTPITADKKMRYAEV